MPTYEQLIQQSQDNVESLRIKLIDMDTLLKDIIKAKEVAEGIPEIFNDRFQELVELSVDYTNTLKETIQNYLDDNNTLFTTKLTDLQAKVDALNAEITRLANTDFTKLFKDLQKVFIDQTRTDLAIELKEFDAKSKDLQTKVDALKAEITRLEKIDLEKHFRELQRTLADIFTAVNGVNTTLTNIIQTLNGIVLSLGTIQTTLGTNHEEAKQLLNSFGETTEKHLIDQDEQATKNVELLESKMKSLSEQNELLKKEVKTNRIIQIIGLAIVLIILIYIATKQ